MLYIIADVVTNAINCMAYENYIIIVTRNFRRVLCETDEKLKRFN